MDNVYYTTTSALIQVHQLVKTYPTGAGEFTALDSLDLAVFPGEFLGIVGKSGAGKTTLINMLSGIDRLTSGEVLVNGQAIHWMGEDGLAVWRGRNIGIIYQSFHLMPTLSLLDNVMLPIDLCGRYSPRTSPKRGMGLLDQVGLADHAHKLPSEISGGQQQRVAIARALANDPPLILADEPTGRLDSANAEHIFSIFLDLVAGGKTILMVTHDPGLAGRVSRLLQLADGRFV